MRNTQRGFTLVEIAIVLVIIGLLLGGILKGQELINSARVRNIADANSGIQAAYFGFIDRYRAVPGDMKPSKATNAIGQAVNVAGEADANRGNGRLDGSNNAAEFTEASALWEHLWKAGFLQGSYDGGATDVATYTGKAPINPFNGTMVLFRSPDYMELSGAVPAVATTDRLNLALGRNIPVNIARELDVKVDDGRPFTGVLRLATTAAAPKFGDLGKQSDGATACHGTAGGANDNEYYIALDAQDCNLVYLY
jgi:prepilin-type N-terminal cleavage/methylation domain-containing protein